MTNNPFITEDDYGQSILTKLESISFSDWGEFGRQFINDCEQMMLRKNKLNQEIQQKLITIYNSINGTYYFNSKENTIFEIVSKNYDDTSIHLLLNVIHLNSTHLESDTLNQMGKSICELEDFDDYSSITKSEYDTYIQQWYEDSRKIITDNTITGIYFDVIQRPAIKSLPSTFKNVIADVILSITDSSNIIKIYIDTTGNAKNVRVNVYLKSKLLHTKDFRMKTINDGMKTLSSRTFNHEKYFEHDFSFVFTPKNVIL